MNGQPRPALVIFWTCVGVVIAALIVFGLAQRDVVISADVTDEGTRPDFSISATPSPTPVASPSATARTSPSPSATPLPTTVAAPTRIRIPAIDVDAKILPVGIEDGGAIEIPADITKVGWYKLGVPPGADRGSAVIVGHRDGRAQGRGAFYWVGNLNEGDKVYVTNSAGDVLPYRVVSREFITKKRLPYEELFAIDGDPRLTLLSCGGYYDRNNGGYQDNVVVTAVPLFDPLVVTTSSAVAAGPSPGASGSSSAPAGRRQPVEVTAPQAGTVVSTPVPLGGGRPVSTASS